MPTPPDIEAVQAYLESIEMTSWAEEDVQDALDSETAAQARVVRFPADPEEGAALPYPADLADALKRRVARNLSLRPLPLGLQNSITEGAALATKVGGLEAEIRGKEATHRKLVSG